MSDDRFTVKKHHVLQGTLNIGGRAGIVSICQVGRGFVIIKVFAVVLTALPGVSALMDDCRGAAAEVGTGCLSADFCGVANVKESTTDVFAAGNLAQVLSLVLLVRISQVFGTLGGHVFGVVHDLMGRSRWFAGWQVQTGHVVVASVVDAVGATVRALLMGCLCCTNQLQLTVVGGELLLELLVSQVACVVR